MRKMFLGGAVALCLAAGAATIAQQEETAPAATQPTLETQKDKVSYLLGYQVGTELKSSGLDIDPALFTRALGDAIAGKESPISEEDAMQIMMALQQEMMAKQQAEMAEQAQRGRGEATAFLAENATKEGVQTTDSGLQYKIITEGEGEHPKLTDQVRVNYRGTLIDGTEFDSSYERGRPAVFPLNRVIEGWQEGIQLTKPGGKIELYIPPELGYGEQGSPPDIPPNSLLIFEVELLGAEEAPEQEQPQFNIEQFQ